MSIASKSACLLLAWLQLAAPALAQNAPPADARRELLRPPELAAPPEAPQPQVPMATPTPPPPFQPTYKATKQDNLLSAQILQIDLAPFKVSRGGVEVLDLQAEVVGSPRASDLIRTGQSQVTTGTIILVATVVVLVGTLIAAIAIDSSAGSHPTNAQNTAYGVTLVSGLVLGIAGEIVGIVITSAGTHKIGQGINAYNQDLLDGRLVPPAATATPPR